MGGPDLPGLEELGVAGGDHALEAVLPGDLGLADDLVLGGQVAAALVRIWLAAFDQASTVRATS